MGAADAARAKAVEDLSAAQLVFGVEKRELENGAEGLKAKLAAAEEQLNGLRGERDSLRERVAESDKVNETQSAAVRALEDALASRASELERAQNELASLDMARHSTLITLEGSESVVAQLKGRVAELEERLRLESAELALTQQQLASVQAHNAAEGALLQNKDVHINRVEADFREVIESHNDLERVCTELNERVKWLERGELSVLSSFVRMLFCAICLLCGSFVRYVLRCVCCVCLGGCVCVCVRGV